MIDKGNFARVGTELNRFPGLLNGFLSFLSCFCCHFYLSKAIPGEKQRVFRSIYFLCLFLQQYQDAIKAHKAGRPVNLSDLPVPPGKLTM